MHMNARAEWPPEICKRFSDPCSSNYLQIIESAAACESASPLHYVALTELSQAVVAPDGKCTDQMWEELVWEMQHLVSGRISILRS